MKALTLVKACFIDTRKSLFHSALEGMVSEYFNVTAFDVKDKDDTDGVRAYAKEVFLLDILLLVFKDSVREGDGEGMMRIW